MNIRSEDPDELRDIIRELEGELEERTRMLNESEDQKEKIDATLGDVQEELNERNQEIKALTNHGSQITLELEEADKYIGVMEDKLSIKSAEIRNNLISHINSLSKKVATKDVEINKLLLERNNSPVTGSPADIFIEATTIEFKITYDLNAIITGAGDEMTDPIYKIGCDPYDHSIEVYFGHCLDPQWTPDFKFLDTLCNKLGAAHGWLNFIDGREFSYGKDKTGKPYWHDLKRENGPSDLKRNLGNYLEDYFGVKTWHIDTVEIKCNDMPDWAKEWVDRLRRYIADQKRRMEINDSVKNETSA